MGCDCKVKCEIPAPWTRQIAAIEIAEADAITDDGQETWNLLASRGIDNVILCGVHLNMCVLGRPFAIRQMTALGKNVAPACGHDRHDVQPRAAAGRQSFRRHGPDGRARRAILVPDIHQFGHHGQAEFQVPG